MPMSKWDEYLAHSCPAPIATPQTTDPRFNDGYYFGVFSDEIYVFFGMRAHPNSNVLDGYAGIRCDGDQHNVRFSRPLWPNRDQLAVGPLSLRFCEPFRQMEAQLEANELGLEFSLSLSSDLPPIEEAVHEQTRGRAILNQVLRYTQVGDARGQAVFEGTEFDLAGASFCRDHSWGIRAAMGSAIEIQADEQADRRGDPRAGRLWLPFHLPSTWGFVQTHWDESGADLDLEGLVGDRGSSTTTDADVVRHCSRDFEYDPDTGAFTNGTLTLVTDRRELTMELASTGAAVNPQGFGYRRGWLDGQQPGVPRGVHVESDVYRFSVDGHDAYPTHVDARRRMGPVEYIVFVSANGERGLAQMEHPDYRR